MYFCIFKKQTAQIKINNQTFQVEIAKTQNEKIKGLSNQKNLKENSGILFVYDDYQVRNFWMNNMNFPLDILWIRDNKLISCEKNVPIKDNQGKISQISSSEPINYVLEINSGLCEKYDLKSRQTVDIQIQ